MNESMKFFLFFLLWLLFVVIVIFFPLGVAFAFCIIAGLDTDNRYFLYFYFIMLVITVVPVFAVIPPPDKK
jgi:hypothetical protein